jgi:hypothetical protein
MATPSQIIFTKLTSLAIAIIIVAWMWGDDFGWLSVIVAGLGGYFLSTVAIAVLIGLVNGLINRSEQKRFMDAFSRDKQDNFTAFPHARRNAHVTDFLSDRRGLAGRVRGRYLLCGRGGHLDTISGQHFTKRIGRRRLRGPGFCSFYRLIWRRKRRAAAKDSCERIIIWINTLCAALVLRFGR